MMKKTEPHKPLSRFFAAFCVGLSLAIVCLNAQAQLFGGFGKKTPTLLPEEEAFAVSAEISPNGKLSVSWVIEDDYYMYRDQFKIVIDGVSVPSNEIQFQQGVLEDDPEFGEVEVYFFNANFDTQLKISPESSLKSVPESISESKTLAIELHGQGCNKPVGVCYPPMKRVISLDTPDILLQNNKDIQQNTQNLSKQEQGIEKSFLAYLLAAFGAGILLSFTPCVLPMIPILAGVIGQHQKQGGLLAFVYVLGTVVTYAIAGAIAGATGAQLQAYFQTPVFIGIICTLLIFLALSLFGAFKIELPSSLQTKLQSMQVNSTSALLSSFCLGLISALIVGACVSPVLILALGAAITQGDPVLGAGIMASMAFGMGLLLIAFGFGAGWLLPKAGPWMNEVQVLFGFMVLAVVIYLLSIFPESPILVISAAWLITLGFYLWQLSQKTAAGLISSVFKMLAFASIAWGTLAIIGHANGGQDIFKPLTSKPLTFKPLESFSSQASYSAQGDIRNIGTPNAGQQKSLPLISVTSLPEALALLEDAKNKQQPALIDFYADWCLDCRRMHKTTFLESEVHQALKSWQLIEIDVTENSEQSTQAKKHFGVFGPPATLFFSANGDEKAELRQYGYLDTQQILSLIEKTHN